MAPSHGPPARVPSPLFFPARSLLLPKPCYKREHPKATWSPLSPKPHGPKLAWLPRLGLNPSANLPLQPAFLTHHTISYTCSILVCSQLFRAAIVSTSKHGPVAWSQSSPSSYAGAVTRGSCLPVTSWVEVIPISLAQSKATPI